MVRTFFALGCLMHCLGLFSCYEEIGPNGSDLVDSAFRNIRIDTSTVVVTSVLIDSLETSGKNVALVGRYKHSLWGVVSSHSFIAYESPCYGTDPDETVVLDSLVLSLAFDGRFVGDTTLQQTLSIYQLTEKIVLNDNGYLYNNSSVNNLDILPFPSLKGCIQRKSRITQGIKSN